MRSKITKEYVAENKMKILKRCLIIAIALVAIFVFLFRTGDGNEMKLGGIGGNGTQVEERAGTDREDGGKSGANNGANAGTDAKDATDSAGSGENSTAGEKDGSANGQNGNGNPTLSDQTANSESQSQATVIVDISGEVKTPQVVELAQGSRIEDAIKSAGGLTKKADLSAINRAAALVDGEKIYIPAKGEKAIVTGDAVTGDGGLSSGNGSATQAAGGTAAGSSGSAGSTATGNASAAGTVPRAGDTAGKININSADSTQLQELNGVGPATAQKIIDYRNTNGRFTKPEDLKNVNGIGDKTYEKMKDYITV